MIFTRLVQLHTCCTRNNTICSCSPLGICCTEVSHFKYDLLCGIADSVLPQVAALQQQLADAHDENKQLLGNLRDWGVSPQPSPLKPDTSSTPDTGAAPAPSTRAVAREGGVSSHGASPAPGVDQAVTEAEAKLQEAEQQLAEVLARARAAESQVLQLQEQAAKEREKVRSDQLLLAREVKKLRTELAAATQVGGVGQGWGSELGGSSRGVVYVSNAVATASC